MSGSPGGSDNQPAKVLEESIGEDHEPEEADVLAYAEWLGIDMEVDADLIWIARAGLRAPLPAPWKPCQAGEEGEVFYFNFETGESVWDHPCDDFHRKLFAREHAKKYGMPLPDESVKVARKVIASMASEGDTGDKTEASGTMESSAAFELNSSAGAPDNSASLGDSVGLEDDNKKRDKKDKKDKKD
eukprot:CAMPEP_0115471072 /NCGR_PEP_ID=MMETSP0271-20121206/52332_1 /TAXON_ID=71861 /ORGANISM="Scrippsiella trochoidea, Strain CCMP3099" /LENGTH=186 /DNA_ID=CAMNT_0002898241 /DNA_START=37 /DNA_END=594 /DNA_ORIENTATION=+